MPCSLKSAVRLDSMKCLQTPLPRLDFIRIIVMMRKMEVVVVMMMITIVMAVIPRSCPWKWLREARRRRD